LQTLTTLITLPHPSDKGTRVPGGSPQSPTAWKRAR